MQKSDSGMSIIEIIIVITLVLTLMAYMASNLIGAREDAMIDQTKLAIGQIQQSLDRYKIHNHRYPTTDQGLSALLDDPGNAKNWRGPYIDDKKLRDPWDEDFSYESDGRKYRIMSAGPNQVSGDEDDINYPEDREE